MTPRIDRLTCFRSGASHEDRSLLGAPVRPVQCWLHAVLSTNALPDITQRATVGAARPGPVEVQGLRAPAWPGCQPVGA